MVEREGRGGLLLKSSTASRRKSGKMKKITLHKWDVAACTYEELLAAMDVAVLGHRARG